MDIITVNVGQGSLAIVRHGQEALIIDARIPPVGDETVAYVKGTLAAFLKGYFVRGLILTGFDEDHSDATGVALILRKYRPAWVMYPKYYKDSEQAKNVFKIIEQEEKISYSEELRNKPALILKHQHKILQTPQLDYAYISALNVKYQVK